MAGHGINSVRLPINYIHFVAGQPELKSALSGTEFEKHADVYQGAWGRIVKAIETARQHNIGVLVDLHGVPGGQNKDSHCGKSDGKVGLWHGIHSASHRKTTIQILVALAGAVGGYENVIGLELMNEPENNSGLETFYVEAIRAIRSSGGAGASLPLYLGDGWNTAHYAKFVAEHSGAGNTLVLDHHLYRCFTPQDHKTPAHEHARGLDVQSNGHTAGWLKDMSRQAQGSIIIGEWSAALNPHSLQGNAQEGQKAFAMAEWQAFEHFTAGYYFWTLKKEGGPDAGWCLYTAMEQGIMPPSLNPMQAFGRQGRSPQELQQMCDDTMKSYYQSHTQYWDKKGGKFDHDCYVDGFRSAWQDSLAIYSHNGAEMGLMNAAAKLRLASYEQSKDHKVTWEFEHGYMQGAAAFKEAVLP